MMKSKAAPGFHFEVDGKDSASLARTGRVRTAHGTFETPAFMPVATQGTVKGLMPKDLREMGTEVILSNAYHLYIRPGIDIISQTGGLHRFMGWEGPILTDSGGFQVFSLSRLRKITDEGVSFLSHFDGKSVFLTPEAVIDIQEAIGSDIAMIFDECPPALKDRKKIQEACERTIRWSQKAKERHGLEWQALFGIVQGGSFTDLRLESLERTVEIGFDGYALGGLCVGETKEETLAVMEAVLPKMPADKPRYLMGIGTPLDFLESVARGADMFDCVTPTRYGRNGTAFTAGGMLVVRNGKYSAEKGPLDENCACYTCRNFSRAYLRHLLNVDEMLGPILISLHNVFFFVRLMKTIREEIRAGKFAEWKRKFTENFDTECR